MFGHLIFPNLNINIWRRRFRIPINVHGIKVLSHLLQSSNVVNALCNGLYETEEIESIKSALQPQDRILDIGCGIGITSLFSARKEPTSIIRSYDANPEVIKLAQMHLKLNQVENCTFNHGVVSEQEKDHLEFFIPEQFWAGSTVNQANSTPISVPNTNFSKLEAEFKPSVIFLDIEGGEYALILKVNWATLHARVLVIEFHSHPRAAESLDAVWPQMSTYYTPTMTGTELIEYLKADEKVTPITITLTRKT